MRKIVHGRSRYERYGCRCSTCRRAKSVSDKKQKRRKGRACKVCGVIIGDKNKNDLCNVHKPLKRSNEEMLDAIRDWSSRNGGRTPSVNQWNETRPGGTVDSSTYLYRFGRWNKAMELAGLKPHSKGWAHRWDEIETAAPEYPSRYRARRRLKNRQMVTGGIR